MNFPILSTIIILPFLGSIFIFLSRSQDNKSAIYVSLFTSVANFLLSLFLWYLFDVNSTEFQFVEESHWISGLIKFKLGTTLSPLIVSIAVTPGILRMSVVRLATDTILPN